MTSKTLTIDLGDIDAGEGMSISGAIIESAARRLLDENREIGALIRDRAKAITDEELRALIVPMLGTALTGAVQPTNRYGEPKGEPMTLREHIVGRADAYMKEIDPDSRHRDGPRKTRIEAYIDKAIAAAIQTDMKGAMDEARKEVVAKVKDSAAAVIAETVTRMVVR